MDVVKSTCYAAVLTVAIFCFPQSHCHPQPSEVGNKAVEIFDAARQTVTGVVDVAQGAVNTAIDVAKNTGINYIDTVQDAATLAVQTGRNVIEFGQNTVLRMLGGTGR